MKQRARKPAPAARKSDTEAGSTGKPAAPAAPKRAAAAPGKKRPAARKKAPPRPEPAEAPPVAADQDPTATAKLDLGPAGRAEKRVRQIPWSYGQDRVTAAAVDPDRLYVYWEVTDDGMERAAASLGPAGREAWLHLRVYDTTGLLFDGTNAHSHFDHRVGRSDRQWFFELSRPTSSAVVEVGMRAPDGGFARIARSIRVDFPRKDPAPWSAVEWMTVVAATGEVRSAGTGLPGLPERETPGPGAGAPGAAETVGAAGGFEPIGVWQLRQTPAEREALLREIVGEAWESVEWIETTGEGWVSREGHVTWQGPVELSTWRSGPIAHPVEVQPPERTEWRGKAVAFTVGGVTHVLYGPWQVVIRHIGAVGEHAELARWEVYRSWVSEGGREQRPAPAAGFPTGASEQLAPGASERAWLAGSELRLQGASELWRLGASELRLRGASELLLQGASERLLRGASERMLAGASERMLGGASERALAGASEQRLGGASESRPAPPEDYPPAPGEIAEGE